MRHWKGQYIALKVCLFFLLLLTGCAFIPSTAVVTDRESMDVEKAFFTMLARQQQCHCCIDVNATVSFKAWLQSGTVEGYLQAMSPSYLKFVGLTPIGQPLMILATNGTWFQYVIVPEAKAYEGSVGADAFNKYAPKGFSADEIFLWLTGRLSHDSITIDEVSKNKEGPGYWLEISSGTAAPKSLVLFDLQNKILLRHILQNDGGKNLMDVQYAAYQAVSPHDWDECMMPSEIIVSSGAHQGTMRVVLNDWLADPVFSVTDFDVALPAGFERIMVK